MTTNAKNSDPEGRSSSLRWVLHIELRSLRHYAMPNQQLNDRESSGLAYRLKSSQQDTWLE